MDLEHGLWKEKGTSTFTCNYNILESGFHD